MGMMRKKPQLDERLRALYDKYEDQEIARCVIQAIDMRDELQRTRWDRARDWTLLVFVSAYFLRLICIEAAKWL